MGAKPWSANDLIRLRQMYKTKQLEPVIARALNRSADAIRSKARDLGLTDAPRSKEAGSAERAAIRTAQASYLTRWEGQRIASDPSGGVTWLYPAPSILDHASDPIPPFKRCQFFLSVDSSGPKCGKPSQPGYSYCPEHKAICWVPRQPTIQKEAEK